MIPKRIHYFWGEPDRPPLMKKCLKSWDIYLPEYKQFEWGINNYDVNKHPFTTKAFAEKKWAFLSDYIRLDMLFQHGGVYMDTDIEVIKPLDNLLHAGVVLGMESGTHVNPSIFAARPRHWFIKEVMDEYSVLDEYIPVPVIMTKVLNRYVKELRNEYREYKDIIIYPTEYFYPFGFNEKFTPNCITKNTYTIHWWNYSWGDGKVKILKRLGLLSIAIRIKNWIKKNGYE